MLSRKLKTILSISPSISYGWRRHYNNHVGEKVREYARKLITPVTLKHMIEMGRTPTPETMLRSAQFLYKELPVRLARRVKELENLPYGLSLTPPVQRVKGWYEASFRDILSVREPQTVEEEEQFTTMLENILARHANVVPTMAQGVLMIKNEMGDNAEAIRECPYLQDFLDRFFMSRIGIRMLIAQHCSLHHPKEGYIGVIALQLSPVKIVRAALADAARICDKEYGIAPEFVVHGDEQQTLAFVPSHLHHIMFEVLKNSMRAVVETHRSDSYEMPAIEIIIANGESDFSIKVSDQGGGIPRKDMQRIWSYMHTTARRPVNLDMFVNGIPSYDHIPMAGFGYGLPLSRLFAQYFGGDLQVVSMDGYGTDAYVHLPKLGDQTLHLE